MALRFRSKKMQKVYVLRRKLVAKLLDERPICERCHKQRATEIHERLSRARGGDILDENNCVALCSFCHHMITIHPQMAEEEGWSLKSGGVDWLNYDPARPE